jgi:hypothetical protein
MRKTILAVLAASLIVATAQSAAAARHHHVRKVAPTATSQAFSNANASLAAPGSPAQPGWYPDYSLGSGLAGR